MEMLAANVSLLTTIQSAIADGLNDYNHVSWFTSAYLVFEAPRALLENRLLTIQDRHGKYHATRRTSLSDLSAAKLHPCFEFDLRRWPHRDSDRAILGYVFGRTRDCWYWSVCSLQCSPKFD